MTHGRETDPALARYRGYLHVLARLRLGPQAPRPARSVGPGPADLAEGQQASDRCEAEDEAGREAWLRQILNNTIADELRRHSRGRRDAARDRSLLASLDESSVRLEAWLADDRSSPSQQAIRHEQLLALAEALDVDARGPAPGRRTAPPQRRSAGRGRPRGWAGAEASVAGLLRAGQGLRDT